MVVVIMSLLTLVLLLQREILAQPWLTFDVICNAQDYWYAGHRREHISNKNASLQFAQDGIGHGELINCNFVLSDEYSARDSFLEQIRKIKRPPDQPRFIELSVKSWNASNIDLAEGVGVPRRLLRDWESMDKETALLLLWLYRAGGFLSPHLIDWHVSDEMEEIKNKMETVNFNQGSQTLG